MEKSVDDEPQRYDKLVHGIYALVHNDDQLPNLLAALDEFFATGDEGDLLNTSADHLSGLLPHVEQANLLLEKIAALHLKSNHADRMLNHIPLGVALVTPQAEIISANTRAIALLDHIHASHEGGTLHFSKCSQRTAFQRAVNAVAAGTSSGTPIVIADVTLWVSQFGEGESAQLAVYLSHRTAGSNTSLHRLMELYHLTQREAQLTALLCDSHSNLETAAEAMGISVNTAKVHLRHAFAKTGTQRKVDLIRMVLTNPILSVHPKRNGQSVDLPFTHLARLPSGRTLSWAEYGDPNGRPILFCHAVTGSRLIPAPRSDVLKDNRLRLIVPDRAGYGFSSPAQSACMRQWIEDMRLFLPQLGIDRCCVLGHSTGGAYAMELAASLPDKIEGLCLVSSIVPLSGIEDVEQLQPIYRMVINLAHTNPQAARAFLKLSLQVTQKKPDSYFGQADDIPALDQQLLDRKGFKPQLQASFSETTRQGMEHMLDELMYLATEWRFDGGRIACPVRIWHGEEDRLTPPLLMRRFSSRFRQCSPVNWVKNAGFFLRVHHWPRIVKHLGRMAIIPLLSALADSLLPLLADSLGYL